MKKVVSIIFLICFYFTSTAQIKKTAIPTSESLQKEIIKYDSLRSISHKNYKSHIGQTLYLKENKDPSSISVYYNFFTTPNPYAKMPFDFAEITYRPVKTANNDYSYKSDYEFMKGRYFDVVDLIFDDEYKSNWMELKETETGDLLYYEIDNLTDFRIFLTLGYFEKLKRNWIGNDFVFLHGDVLLKNTGLKSYTDKSKLIEIPNKSLLKCIDIIIEDGGNNDMYAVLEDNQGNTIIYSINEPYAADVSFGSFNLEKDHYLYLNNLDLKRFDIYKKELKDSEEYKASLIKKYGKSNADKILKGIVSIGFTKEMCIESWGNPKDINSTTGTYGKHEQWVYSYDRYLYFENGKLTTIQD